MDTATALILAAVVLTLAGIPMIWWGNAANDWPKVTARVLSVEAECSMTTRVYRRRSHTVVVPCSQVEQFRADNPDDDWAVRRSYRGDVRLTGPQPPTVINMPIPGHNRQAPRVGDTFSTFQNPADPQEVTSASVRQALTFAGYCILGLGIFLGICTMLWL